jgi:hypothetical protein
LCFFFDLDAWSCPLWPNGTAPVFPGNCPDAPPGWAKAETAPLPRLAVASGFTFICGGLRLLTPLCPILVSSSALIDQVLVVLTVLRASCFSRRVWVRLLLDNRLGFVSFALLVLVAIGAHSLFCF